MKIAVADDYQGLFGQAPNHALLAGHEVSVFSDAANSIAVHAARLRDAQIMVLTQQRTRFPRGFNGARPRGRPRYRIQPRRFFRRRRCAEPAPAAA